MSIDGRFPSPGVDKRFETPGVDWEHGHYPDDKRFPVPGSDTRFDADGIGYGEGAADPVLKPVVLPNQHFNALLMLTEGQVLGTVLAEHYPTSFAIVSGDAEGWFAITNAGEITVTAAGANIVNGGMRYLGITATNATGTSDPVNVAIQVQWG